MTTLEYEPELLLAYYRGELHDREQTTAIEEKLASDPRWQAHFESIQDLDLERLAARHDAAELESYATALSQNPEVTPHEETFVWLVARTEGACFANWSSKPERERKQWNDYLNLDDAGVVYCRRQRRRALARERATTAGLPADEKLLRDWLLEDYYRASLDKVTELLRRRQERVQRTVGDTVQSGVGRTAEGISPKTEREQAIFALCLAELPEELADIFLMRFHADFKRTEEQIAARCKLTVGEVRRLLDEAATRIKDAWPRAEQKLAGKTTQARGTVSHEARSP